MKHLYDCDYVINTAAESHVGNSIIDSKDFISSNIMGVQNLLDLIRNKPENCNRRPILFHFSTDEVYGDITEGEHTETDLLHPSNPYSAAKAAADMLILAWARTYKVEYVILRPTNNYGIGQYPEKLIPLSVKNLMRGKNIRLHDGGTPIRNWLHADDTAEAVLSIIDAGVINEVYNVAGGFEQPNIDTVRKVMNCFFNEEYQLEDFLFSRWSRCSLCIE
jgi:dTDP-glucose 4,6-dehydratase